MEPATLSPALQTLPIPAGILAPTDGRRPCIPAKDCLPELPPQAVLALVRGGDTSKGDPLRNPLRSVRTTPVVDFAVPPLMCRVRLLSLLPEGVPAHTIMDPLVLCLPRSRDLLQSAPGDRAPSFPSIGHPVLPSASSLTPEESPRKRG